MAHSANKTRWVKSPPLLSSVVTWERGIMREQKEEEEEEKEEGGVN